MDVSDSKLAYLERAPGFTSDGREGTAGGHIVVEVHLFYFEYFLK